MANVLVTVSKGEIKNVDGFIKAFRSVGHNMKVLAISGYEFMTNEDKELSIEFGKRVRDELGMSKATLSNLRTAGYLYKLNDNFLPFSYTNVVSFKKVVKKLEDSELLTEANINKTLIDIARFADSQQPEEVTTCAEFLASLSQKNLESIISKFLKSVDGKGSEEIEETAEEIEETEEAVEETEEAVEETEEAVEEATFYNIIDDDFAEIMNTLTIMINEKSLSKKELVEYAGTVYNRLSRYAE